MPGHPIGGWRRPPAWRLRLDQLLHGRCHFCNGPITDGGICPGCREDLPWITAGCRCCGAPISSGAWRCAGCIGNPPPFARTHALWQYRDGIDDCLRAFKDRGDTAAGRLLTGLAAPALERRRLRLPGPLVPMPLHRQRWRQRGFNQSALIARWLGGPCLDDLVERARRTADQRGLDASQRRANQHKAFRLRRPPPRAVTLVDDVMTTGASLRALAQCLREGGTEHIQVLVLARAV
jgi:ComF family protein